MSNEYLEKKHPELALPKLKSYYYSFKKSKNFC